MNTTPFQNQTVDQQYAVSIATLAAAELQQQVQRFARAYAAFWGIPVAGKQGGPPQRAYPTLDYFARVAAHGTSLQSIFVANLAWATFIEAQANAYIAANGVPAAGSTMSFLLPFITVTTFALPGIPAGYTVTWSSDGSGVLTRSAT